MQPSAVSGKIESNALVSLGAFILELWLDQEQIFGANLLMAILYHVADLAQCTKWSILDKVKLICSVGDHHLLTSTWSMGVDELTTEAPLKCLFLCTLGPQQQLSHSGSLLDLLLLAGITGVIQIKPLRAKLAFQSSHSFRHMWTESTPLQSFLALHEKAMELRASSHGVLLMENCHLKALFGINQ